jgi:hypothetical protein
VVSLDSHPPSFLRNVNSREESGMGAQARMLGITGVRAACARVVASGVLVGVVLSAGPGISASARASLPSCSNAAFRVGVSAQLPDCRAYEQVSPLDKGGFAAYPTAAPPVQLSSSGEALAYLNYQAFPGAVGNTALFAAHVSTRTAGGWQTAEWTPKIPKAEVLKLYKVDYLFSSDLSQAVLQVPLVPLTPGATPYVQNLFLRNLEGAYSLVNSASPRISPEEICGLGLLAICWQFGDQSAYAGASSDFSHVLFESNAQLTPEAPETFIESLYESSAGTVRLTGILPDGTPAATSTAGAGTSVAYASGEQQADRSVERAVSEDGSHVVFQAPADGGEPDPEQGGLTEVYDRIDGTDSIEISAPAPGATPAVTTPEPATFQTTSVDGSRVIFTSAAELTTPSNTGEANNGEDLYEYDLETQQLTDLTVDTNPADASTGAKVLGVVGSSSDGSYVYFVAAGRLVEGKGIDGQPNLYMEHEGGRPEFIATLNGEDSCNFSASESGDSCVWTPFPVIREAYVTPDGRHMAFMSTKSLPTVDFPSGYNNIDQATGKADSEVYSYTAPTKPEGTGQLICASCDPTGAQPVGNALIGGISPTGGEQEGRPGYNGIGTPFYRVRSLSDDGRRLFYTAPSSLAAPFDRVYEYEQAGEGSCESARGCRNLISSPNTSEADYFLGSSANGSDVFLATSSRLTSMDSDNLSDVYDARVDGGIAPVPTEVVCVHECHAVRTSAPDALPESDTTGLSRNLPPVTPTKPSTVRRKCKKGLRLSHGRCVKAKKKHRGHGKTNTRAAHKSSRAQ